jgi:hypothetical protein
MLQHHPQKQETSHCDHVLQPLLLMCVPVFSSNHIRRRAVGLRGKARVLERMVRAKLA